MWIYRFIKENELPYEVGYFDMVVTEIAGNVAPEYRFQSIEGYKTKDEARKAVNYLNGGNSQIEVSGIVYNKD